MNESRSLPWGSTMLVVSATPTDSLLSVLSRMKRAGRRVALVLVGGPEFPVSTDGLTIYHVRDDIMWTALEALSISKK